MALPKATALLGWGPAVALYVLVAALNVLTLHGAARTGQYGLRAAEPPRTSLPHACTAELHAQLRVHPAPGDRTPVAQSPCQLTAPPPAQGSCLHRTASRPTATPRSYG
jgi:hypothetical protein